METRIQSFEVLIQVETIVYSRQAIHDGTQKIKVGTFSFTLNSNQN